MWMCVCVCGGGGVLAGGAMLAGQDGNVWWFGDLFGLPEDLPRMVMDARAEVWLRWWFVCG